MNRLRTGRFMFGRLQSDDQSISFNSDALLTRFSVALLKLMRIYWFNRRSHEHKLSSMYCQPPLCFMLHDVIHCNYLYPSQEAQLTVVYADSRTMEP